MLERSCFASSHPSSASAGDSSAQPERCGLLVLAAGAAVPRHRRGRGKKTGAASRGSQSPSNNKTGLELEEMATVGVGGVLTVFDAASRAVVRQFAYESPAQACSFAVTPSGHAVVAVGTAEGRVSVQSLRSGEELLSLREPAALNPPQCPRGNGNNDDDVDGAECEPCD